MRVLAAVLGAVLLLAVAHVAQAGDADQVHYPDLRTLTPSEIKVQRDRSTGERLLRFSNTVANLGQGRLELRPEHNAATGTTDAYQRLYSHDTSGVEYLVEERQVGSFEFHVAHNHWHFEDFAEYQLRTVAADGSPGAILRSSEKVTFCIIDVGLVDGSLEHASGRTYTSCEQNATQGLSVGWGDTYRWNLDGQSIDITGIPNGEYWLVSIADPLDVLDEGGAANEANNSGAIKIRLRGNGVKVLP